MAGLLLDVVMRPGCGAARLSPGRPLSLRQLGQKLRSGDLLAKGSSRKSKSGPGWGDPGTTTEKGEYPNGLKDVARRPAWRYEEYGGPPPGTVFGSVVEACDQCIAFYPEKLGDGGKFGSPEYKDAKGGHWEQRCRAGPCNFREPQTQPWGGVLGAGSVADPSVGWWKGPDDGTCFTLDPVFKFQECEPALRPAARTTHDLLRWCGYKHQIAALPMEFAGAKTPFTRLGGGKEECQNIIEKEGHAFYDDKSFFDSDLKALSGCCENSYEVIKCVIDEGLKKSDIIMNDLVEFNNTMNKMRDMGALFEAYCTPICEFDEAEFCSHYPTSDKCAKYSDCESCVMHSGTWHFDTKECKKDGPWWTAKTPIQCKPTTPPPMTTPPPTEPPPPPLPPPEPDVPPPEPVFPPCKYLEVSKIWSQALL